MNPISILILLHISDAVVVRLRNGAVFGKHQRPDCNAFLGIPYAKPPIGPLRFKAPVPLDPRESIVAAFEYKPSCMQFTGPGHYLSTNVNVSEDCLYLNVFAPTAPISRLPVMVWIHGGGYYFGSSAFANNDVICDSMVSQNVVVVSISYRLGAFGFLAAESAASNAGLRDIILALKWFRENAVAFGADATRITLVGHGSGAALVSLLTIMPTASDLISQAILMSGSSLSSWAVTNHSYRSTMSLLQTFNCLNRSVDYLTECLQQLSAKKILENTPALWSPYVDGENGILPSEPRDLLQSAKKSTPTILGFTKNEASLLAIKKLLRLNTPISTDMLKEELIPQFASYFFNAFTPLEEAIKFQYFNSMPLDNMYTFIHAVINLYSDHLFKAPIFEEAKLRSEKNPSAPVYMYSFERKLLTPGSGQEDGWLGAPHSIDLYYLWSSSSSPNPSTQNMGPFITMDNQLQQAPVGDRILALAWTNFVKAGKPLYNIWREFRLPNMSLLRIGTGLEQLQMINAIDNDDYRLIMFWNNFVKHIIASNQVTYTSTTQRTTMAKTTATASSSSQMPTKSKSPLSIFITLPTTTSMAATTTVATTATTTTTTTATEAKTITLTEQSLTIAWQNETTSATFVKEANATSGKSLEPTGETSRVMWVMVGLALFFFLSLLFTAAACTVWNKQSYQTSSTGSSIFKSPYGRAPQPRKNHGPAAAPAPIVIDEHSREATGPHRSIEVPISSATIKRTLLKLIPPSHPPPEIPPRPVLSPASSARFGRGQF